MILINICVWFVTLNVFIGVVRREYVLALFFCDIHWSESSSKFHKYCKISEQKPRNGRVNLKSDCQKTITRKMNIFGLTF